jgi:hypothetical protein
MRVTKKLLESRYACREEVGVFHKIWPGGADPTFENLWKAYKEMLNIYWVPLLLPPEGLESRRAYVVWCAEQVRHYYNHPEADHCFELIKERINNSEGRPYLEKELCQAYVKLNEVCHSAHRQLDGSILDKTTQKGLEYHALKVLGASYQVCEGIVLNVPVSGAMSRVGLIFEKEILIKEREAHPDLSGDQIRGRCKDRCLEVRKESLKKLLCKLSEMLLSWE